MKVLILCDHYPLSPRVKKIRNSIIKFNTTAEVRVFAWNREGRNVIENYVDTFNQDIGYGNRIKKLLNLLKFRNEAALFAKGFKPDYIHTIDVEMLIIGKSISKYNELVYEVYDLKFFENKLVNIIREKIEIYIINKNVDSIILASPYFKLYYENKIIKDLPIITMNNKPSSNLDLGIRNNYLSSYSSLLNKKKVIGFVGTIRYKEILINLIHSVKDNPRVVILLAGNGPDFKDIEDFVFQNNYQEKVIMTGRYEQSDLATIYHNCDYIWAAYPNKDLNVKYAISNKFFESLVFNKKIFVSENTLVGEAVIKLEIGHIIDPYSPKDIEEKIGLVLKEKNNIVTSVFGTGKYWEDEEDRLKNIY